jgi:hypothetical protein
MAHRGGFITSPAPKAVADGMKPPGVPFIAFAVGGIAGASCGVTNAGSAYCWGQNYFGSLGDGVCTAGAITKAASFHVRTAVSVRCPPRLFHSCQRGRHGPE